MAIPTCTEEDLIAVHKKERKDLQGKEKLTLLQIDSGCKCKKLLINFVLAKIQVLKKSICKGDKKKKKEITEEIFKLESDLDKKQDEEIAHFRMSEISINKSSNKETEVNGENEIDNDQNNREELKPPNRISKAQKRREKKEKAEKERNQRILEQEAENVHGERNVEINEIEKILNERNLIMHEIPSDGNW